MPSIDGFPEAESESPSTGGNWTSQLLSIALTLAILAFLVTRYSGIDEILAGIGRISINHLFFPLTLSFAAVLLSILRWNLLLKAMGWAVPLGQTGRAVMASWPVAVLTPSRAGDIMRASVIRKRVPLLPGIASVLLEKLIDLQSVIALFVLASAWHGRWGFATIGAASLVAFWLAFLIVPRLLTRLSTRWNTSSTVHARIQALAASSSDIRKHPGTFLTVILLSVTAWVITLIIIGSLLKATSSNVDLKTLTLAWPVSVLASALPFTISGIGLRDGALLLAIQRLGPAGAVEDAAILTASLLYPFVTSWFFALLGLPFLMHLPFRSRRELGKGSRQNHQHRDGGSVG